MEKPKRLVVILDGIAMVLFCIIAVRSVTAITDSADKVVAGLMVVCAAVWTVRFVVDLKRYLSKKGKG